MPDEPKTPTAVLVENLRRLRRKRGYTAETFAERLTELGMEIGRVGVVKLEGGNRKSIGVDEIYILSKALDVSPLALVTPEKDDAEVVAIPGKTDDQRITVSGERLGKWVAGDDLLERADVTAVFEFMAANPHWKKTDQFNTIEKVATTIAPWTEAEHAGWKASVGDDRPDLIQVMDGLRRMSRDVGEE